MAAECALGREPRDVSADKVGYDIESRDPTSGHLHLIEVKGRIDGGDTITATPNEMLVSLIAGERFVLAIVPLGEMALRTSRSMCGVRSIVRRTRMRARSSSSSTSWCRGGLPRADATAQHPERCARAYH
ncbi:MAG: DUF3883 domain-containing protein [Acetobacteraceae bacterium]|nr:DUF3883 domain-containing protein [Acetobacteraceae bacterium]